MVAATDCIAVLVSHIVQCLYTEVVLTVRYIIHIPLVCPVQASMAIVTPKLPKFESLEHEVDFMMYTFKVSDI